MIILFILVYVISVILAAESRNEDAEFWMSKGKEELWRAESLAFMRGQRHFKRPKNVILFVGDGMDLTTQNVARIRKGQLRSEESSDEEDLIWEQFPSLGLLKTYSIDYLVADSAATATALFSGVKTKSETLGYDSSIEYENVSSVANATKVESILTWAQRMGMATGFVTNMRLTHATPAALYAHSASRDWECDAKIPVEAKDTIKDIARQFVENMPGKRVKVALGGGLGSFMTGLEVDRWTCGRQDGKNLVLEWLKKHEKLSKSAFVENRDELMSLEDVDYLLGLFSISHMKTVDDITSEDNQPTLTEMASKAIEILAKDPHGFLLVVENGLIDFNHHFNLAQKALSEVLSLDETIRAAIDLVDLNETLVMVTSDHGHPLAFTGEPLRGSDVTGYGTLLDTNGKPIPILSYASGPGAKMNDEYTKTLDNPAPALFHLYSGKHAGQDVPIHAIGPMNYFFHKVHEQNYVAHVIAYALCSGPYQDSCRRHVDYMQNDNPSGKIVATSFKATSKASDVRNRMLVKIIQFSIIAIVFYVLKNK